MSVKKYQHLKKTPDFVVIPTLRTLHSIVFCFTLEIGLHIFYEKNDLLDS